MIATDLLPLVNHLWQSTLCVGAVWLLTIVLQNNRAAVRYRLWLASSVKFLIPFSLLVSIGSRIGWRTSAPVEQPNWPIIIAHISRPFELADPVSQNITSPGSDAIAIVLVGLWFSGFCVSLIFWVRCWQGIKATRRTGIPLALNLTIPVMSTRFRVEPCVSGISRPVLLLPEGITDYLTPAQLELVLAHELCHVRRRDNLTAAIHMLVEAVFWFYPLIWWIRTRLIEERERACDEEIARTSGDPEVYAEGILNVCKFYLKSCSACISGVAGANLRKRLAEIMARRIVHDLGCLKRILLAAVTAAAVVGPIAIGMLHPSASHAQSQVAATLAHFEVASIKPTDPAFRGTRVEILPNDNMVNIRGMTLKGLIELAYNPGFGLLHPSLVAGGPKWYDRDRYDVLAKSEGHRIPSQEERKQMLRSLLAERFNLTLHRESKEITAFALIVGRKGSRMRAGQPDASGGPSIVLRGLSMTGRNASMPELAATLQPMMPLVDPTHVDFPVVDRTGLTGRFDFDLKFALDQTKAGVDAALSPNVPDLFTAIQEQLGLKLGLTKTPVEALVVDHAEMPSPN